MLQGRIGFDDQRNPLGKEMMQVLVGGGQAGVLGGGGAEGMGDVDSVCCTSYLDFHTK